MSRAVIDPARDVIRLLPMNTVESASKILDTMLGHLGIAATIETQETEEAKRREVRELESQR